jgi:hypothetical protein
VFIFFSSAVERRLLPTWIVDEMKKELKEMLSKRKEVIDRLYNIFRTQDELRRVYEKVDDEGELEWVFRKVTAEIGSANYNLKCALQIIEEYEGKMRERGEEPKPLPKKCLKYMHMSQIHE